MFTRVIISLAIVFIFSGCTLQPHAVLIKPDVNVQSGDIGSGKSIMLTVIDERAKKTLGTTLPKRVNIYGSSQPRGGVLTIEGNIVEIVSDSLSKGLLAQGFQITKSPDEGTAKLKELRVELKALEYRIVRGSLDIVKTKSKMRGICIVDSLYSYEKLYRGAYRKNLFLSGYPTGFSINKYVNIPLSQAINNLLSDSRLLKCLAN
jgi:uncharacterized lipoprotein YajG